MNISDKDFQKIIKTLESIDRINSGQAIKGDITEYLITGSKLYDVQELLKHLKTPFDSLKNTENQKLSVSKPVATDSESHSNLDNVCFQCDLYFLIDDFYCDESGYQCTRLSSEQFCIEEHEKGQEKKQGANLSKYTTDIAKSLSHLVPFRKSDYDRLSTLSNNSHSKKAIPNNQQKVEIEEIELFPVSSAALGVK